MSQAQTDSSPLPADPAVGRSADPTISQLSRQVELLEQALQSGRWIRLGILGLVVLVAVAMTWRFVGLAARLQSDQNLAALAAAGQTRLERRLPLVHKEMRILVDESSPVLTTAFYSRAKQDLPKFMASVEAQAEPLAESLKQKLGDLLLAAYEKKINENMQFVRDEIPEAVDPKVQAKIEAHFQEVIKRLVQKHYLDQVAGQFELMFKVWDEFPVEHRQANDPPLPDALMEHLMEMAGARMVGDDRPAFTTGRRDAPVTPRVKKTPVENKSEETQADAAVSTAPPADSAP